MKDVKQLRLEEIAKSKEIQIQLAKRNSNEHYEDDISLINELYDSVINGVHISSQILNKLQDYNKYNHSTAFFRELVNPNFANRNKDIDLSWSIDDFVIINLISYDNIVTRNNHSISAYLSNLLSQLNTEESLKCYALMKSLNIPFQQVIQNSIGGYSIKNPLGEFNRSAKTFTNSTLGDILKEETHLIPALIKENTNFYRRNFQKNILEFSYFNTPELLTSEVIKSLTLNNNHNRNLHSNIYFLLYMDVEKYESLALKAIRISNNDETIKASILYKINEYTSGKYTNQIIAIGEENLNKYIDPTTPVPSYGIYPAMNGMTIPIAYSKYLLSINKEKGRERIKKYVNESRYLSTTYVLFIQEEFKEEALPLIIKALEKDKKIVGKYYLGRVLELFKNHDISDSLTDIVNIMTKVTKSDKKAFAEHLSKYINKVEPIALELTKGKKIDERITGALLLSYSNDPNIKTHLLNLTDNERNDDTRDIIHDSIFDLKFSTSYTFDEVEEMISIADKRKKLSKWSEKLLIEEELPSLYWKNGDELSNRDIRFLFYRCKRAKGLNVDIEAKQLITSLDKSKSSKFANALLQGFKDSNSNTKFKYYLTIAGLIGNDETLTKLHTLFRNAISEKRFKLAENIVGTIALIGTNKALRITDMISRKYSNKRAYIGDKAKEGLLAAASNLDITPDELSDRIIPSFGFENLYKTFEVEGEEYRAFINKEFKINFFNENNKLRKSIPKGVTKEIAAEFKSITKDIREVVKNQKGKFEEFLVKERKWAIEDWTEYYLNNPIMIIYVQKLIWGLYKDNTLVDVFYCDDDIELYNEDDEEIDLGEGNKIGIVHPIHMTEIQISTWKNKIYDMSMLLEFPILERGIYSVQEDDKEHNYTNVLNNTDIPKGADFVGTFLLKKGWSKETGDGGRLNFYKRSDSIHVHAHIEGPQVFYQEGKASATIHGITFSNFKNYREKLKLSDVPPVFYSEIINDLTELSEA